MSKRDKIQKEENTTAVLGPCFQFSRALGLFPYTEKGDFSKPVWSWFIVVLLLLVVFAFPAEISEYAKKWKNRKTISIKLQATLYLARKPLFYSSLFFHARNTIVYRKQFAVVLKYLVRHRYRRNNRLMFGILAWSLLTEINYAYFRTNLSSLEKIFFNVRSWTFFAARTFNMIVTLQYILLTGYLRQRLVRTRSALKRRPTAAMLEAGSVVDMCQSVVRCYGQQMLVLFADSTYALISWAYFFLTLNNRPDNSNYMKISEKVFLAVILLFQIGGPTSINEKANKSAEAFNNELFKLMRDSKELCSNSKLQLYLTMKQTVNFTACGFFSLGYPLVTSIIAAATTYLVILIQFSSN